MFNLHRSLLVLGVILPLLIGCTAYHQHSAGKHAKVKTTMKDHVTIKPLSAHEECLALKKGQILVYKFSSTKPVNFNIHYHDKHQVHYPVSISEITEDDGIIDTAEHEYYSEDMEYYCLMWEEKEMRTVHISYECTVRER